MPKSKQVMYSALVLAFLSIIFTRVIPYFTLAEVLAILSFLAGVSFFLLHRREAASSRLSWPQKLVVGGSFIGLSGLVVKLILVMLGIGEPTHDMSQHETTASNPMLEHIHHLFFNIGFLFMIIAVVWMGVRRLRGETEAT